jgi:hypothetical protein
MLHTCWCIGLVCLNSNLHLNSFVCCVSKISKIPFPFYPSLLSLSDLFLFWHKASEVQRCPSFFPPAARQPARPSQPLEATQPSSARVCTRSCRSPAKQTTQLAHIAGPRRPLSPTGGTRLSSPTSRRDQLGHLRRRRVLRHDLLGVAHTPRGAPGPI